MQFLKGCYILINPVVPGMQGEQQGQATLSRKKAKAGLQTYRNSLFKRYKQLYMCKSNSISQNAG